MLPELGRVIQTYPDEKALRVSMRLMFLVRLRGLTEGGLESPDKRVLEAMLRLSRLDFLLPCYEYVDRIASLNNAKAKEQIENALMGMPTHIWTDRGSKFINSTDTTLVARMVDQALPESGQTDRALVIGSGCGYVPALLADIGFAEVVGVERIKELAQIGRETLNSKGFRQVRIVHANAFTYIKKHKSPFDTIVVFAAVESKKALSVFANQLAVGGRLVAPLGEPENARLVQVTRTVDRLSVNNLNDEVVFTLCIRPLSLFG